MRLLWSAFELANGIQAMATKRPTIQASNIAIWKKQVRPLWNEDSAAEDAGSVRVVARETAPEVKETSKATKAKKGTKPGKPKRWRR